MQAAVDVITQNTAGFGLFLTWKRDGTDLAARNLVVTVSEVRAKTDKVGRAMNRIG